MALPTPVRRQPSPIITLFGSSRLRPGEPEYETAYEIGSLLARAGYTLCNGGYGGTMEASARGAKDAGGKTIGVLTEFFGRKANDFIGKTIVMKTHTDRLLKLVELGEAFIVLRGSTGTLLELATVWEYLNKGILADKPVIILGEFWAKVVETLKHELEWEGRANATRYITMVKSPSDCMAILHKHFAGRRAKT